VCVYVCVHPQRPHCQINFICLFVACYQIVFKFVMDSPTKKPREAQFLFLDSVTVNTVVHTESEACQKQCARHSFRGEKMYDNQGKDFQKTRPDSS